LRNRRYLKFHLDQSPPAHEDEHPSERRQPRPGKFTFCLLDLDHFKQINDRYGHEAGDVVLIEVARRIRAGLRASDVALRWGGEEFLVIGRGHGEASSSKLAQRLLTAVGREPVRLPGGQSLTVTCSLGFTPMPWATDRAAPRLNRDQILNLADIALYLSKFEGRNRACGVFPGSDAGIVDRIIDLDIDLHGLRREDGRGLKLVTIPGPGNKNA